MRRRFAWTRARRWRWKEAVNCWRASLSRAHWGRAISFWHRIALPSCLGYRPPSHPSIGTLVKRVRNRRVCEQAIAFGFPVMVVWRQAITRCCPRAMPCCRAPMRSARCPRVPTSAGSPTALKRMDRSRLPDRRSRSHDRTGGCLRQPRCARLPLNRWRSVWLPIRSCASAPNTGFTTRIAFLRPKPRRVA